MNKAVRLLPLATVVLLWAVLFRPTFLGGSTTYVLVAGTSMEPTLHTGDLVLLREQSSYDIGDIVTFQTTRGRVIHRIVGGSAEGGFLTQGDNKDRVDPWTPRPGDIAGKQWIRIPAVGKWVEKLGQPLYFGLFTGLGGLVVFGKQHRRRMRRNGRWKDMGTNNTPGGLAASPWLVATFGAACVVAIFMLFGAAQAFRTQSEASGTVVERSYTHSASFDYRAEVPSSELYPTGVIGPVHAGDETPPAIFVNESPLLEVGVDYAFEPGIGGLPQQVSGRVDGVVRVSAGEQGWTKDIPFAEPTTFTGDTTRLVLPVDTASIRGLIETIEQQTGYAASSYTVSVLPTFDITAEFANTTVHEQYRPEFAFSLDDSRLLIQSELSQSEPVSKEAIIRYRPDANILGLSMPVTPARWMFGVGSLLALALAGQLAATLFLGLGRGEAARIRARYGSMVVSVAEAQLNEDESQHIRLATIHDLVRFARRDNRMILHHAREDEDVYFVQDGSLTYLYASPRRVSVKNAAVERA